MFSRVSFSPVKAMGPQFARQNFLELTLVVRRTFVELDDESPRHLREGQHPRSLSVPCPEFMSSRSEPMSSFSSTDPEIEEQAGSSSDSTLRMHIAAPPHAMPLRETHGGESANSKPRNCIAPPPGVLCAGFLFRPVSEPVRTTVAVRNIPPHFSKFELMHVLNNAGLCSRYNFVYLPIDFRSEKALGYAFVNFNDSECALDAFDKLKGAMADDHELGIEWSASQQGYDTLVQRYRNSPVMHSIIPAKYKPIILAYGQPVPFPPPSISLKAPRRYITACD